MLGIGLLPDWLRNLTLGRAMVVLVYYNDNLGLWRCIAFHSRALPHWSTQAARELAKSYLNLRTTLLNVPKTSLDKLDKVKRHFNQGKELADWLGIRVYEPEG